MREDLTKVLPGWTAGFPGDPVNPAQCAAKL
jgi:hypothetical protein